MSGKGGKRPGPARRGRRGLIGSLVMIGVLVLLSLAGLLSGVRPLLGLDLQGGVRVVLQAPGDTAKPVMEQALESIRRRVDALGVAEPDISLSGTNIEVQIPGLAKGKILERPKTQYCLASGPDTTYDCFASQEDASAALEAVEVTPREVSVELKGSDGTSYGTFGTSKDAEDALNAISVAAQGEEFCLSGTGVAEQPCFKTEEKANSAKDEIKQAATTQYDLVGEKGKSIGPSNDTKAQAEAALEKLNVEKRSVEYCVEGSDGSNLGCYFTQGEAQNRLQGTSQQHVLEIIGKTARLEERQVLKSIPKETAPGTPNPDWASTPVTCPAELQPQEGCTFQDLEKKPVTFLGKDGKTKYQLGPVEITGDAITKATAAYRSATETDITSGWIVTFQLSGEGAEKFGEVTTRLAPSQAQLAIILDNEVISAPTVQSPITGGSGEITGGDGGFAETAAKDLATQLNAGALPTTLNQQAVETVSATLGNESLKQGLLAGIVGLIALMAYLAFYYRLLGVVTWFGMAIWAILALGIVSLLGRTVGYSLTLAGVAGLIVSLGITADSYIVFYERIKDEVRHGKTPRSAIQPAFGHAWHTIVAADLVTILAAAVLYLLAISSVRGFALTLGICTALDMFVVYFFKRPTVFLLSRSQRLMNLPGFGLTIGVAADLPATTDTRSPEPAAVAGGSK